MVISNIRTSSSIDQSFDSWQNAATRFLDHQPVENYFLDSLNREKVMENFSFSVIPKYLHFDQEGKLIHQNAPRPGSEEITVLIDQYLSNN